MDRGQYCDRVLSCTRRLTGRERAAVRAELDGHIEDHMEGLLDLGYPPELAEERTMAAMGDPAEVGRELNRQYPLGWLVIGRAAAALTLATALLLAAPLAQRFSGAWESLYSRLAPKSVLDISQVREGIDPLGVEAWDTDVEIAIRDQHFRVYQVGFQGGAAVLAEVSWCMDPFQENLDWMDGVSRHVWVNGVEDGLAVQPETGSVRLLWVRARPGDVLTLTWEVYGETGKVELTLPEEVTP